MNHGWFEGEEVTKDTSGLKHLERFNTLHGPGVPKEMDDTDRKLLALIDAKPRMHLRELASILGISRQAVHTRMQILTETGVIRGTIAGISVPYLNAVPVTIFGTSKTASIEKTLGRLGESEFSRRAVVAGGNFFYVVGFLRNVSELGGYVEFVKQAAEMPEPTVGINCLDDGLSPNYSVDGVGKRKESYRELSPLDLKIIASLKDNARRPIADIAEIVGVTPKTVRRYLEKMISDGSLDMSVPVDSQAGGDLFLTMHVNLKDGADKIGVGKRLLSKEYFLDQYFRTFSNLPSLLVWVFWSDKITEVRKVLTATTEDEDVHSAILNFAYLERIYTTTWRDKLPVIQTHLDKKPRTQKPHPVLGIR